LPSLMSEKAEAEGLFGEADARSDRSFQIRFNAAARERNVPIPPQINNGDETRYDNFIGNYSQGLPHNPNGEVVPSAYQALLTAVATGRPSDFANIPLGGNTKLAGPQGGLAFDLEGTDSGQLTIPPSPTLAGAERAGEMVEDYWMALARDVPFSEYGNESTTAAAITDLNNLSRFKGPKVNGLVTPDTLFRGFTPGDLIGPYLSQFFLLPLSLGTLPVAQKYNTYTPGKDYLTDFTSWLAVQNGQGPFPANVVSGTSYIKDGRDLGTTWTLPSKLTCSRPSGCWATRRLSIRETPISLRPIKREFKPSDRSISSICWAKSRTEGSKQCGIRNGSCTALCGQLRSVAWSTTRLQERHTTPSTETYCTPRLWLRSSIRSVLTFCLLPTPKAVRSIPPTPRGMV
jgi:hypothetical protein